MADKKLESITFPDLPDRYVVKPDIADVTGLQTALDGKADAEDVYNGFVSENIQGSIASFDDGADDIPVKSLVAEIVPLQSGSGDPSPDNVRAISGWTEANISVTGKNMFYGTPISGKTANHNGTLTEDVNSPYSAPQPVGFFHLPFTVSADLFPITASNTQVRCTLYDENDSVLATLQGNSITEVGQRSVLTVSESILTTYPTVSKIWLGCRLQGGGKVENIQLEEGTTATTYEPYNGQTYTISFASAGTVYGGSIDVTTGVLTIDRVGVDMGTLDYTYSSTSSIFDSPLDNMKNPSTGAERATGIMCEEYKPSTVLTVNENMDDLAMLRLGGHIYFRNTNYSSASAFKTASSGVILVYELATPQTYQLTPTEVKTLLGNNNVWADTGDIDLTYRADLGLYLDKIINA